MAKQKLQVKRCTICKAFITGVFDKCINCSGLTLPSNVGGRPLVLDQRPVMVVKKEKLTKESHKEKPDNRNGTTRLVSAWDERYDELDMYPLYNYPFDQKELNFDKDLCLMLYEQHLLENRHILEACIKKSIGTYDTPLALSRAAIIFKLVKQIYG